MGNRLESLLNIVKLNCFFIINKWYQLASNMETQINFVVAQKTQKARVWGVGQGYVMEGQLVGPVNSQSDWAYGWTNQVKRGIVSIETDKNHVYVQDTDGSKYILCDPNIGVCKVKKPATFEYGGSVGTVENRCPHTGRASNYGQGEITADYIKRWSS